LHAELRIYEIKHKACN